ncbi:DUF3078 domain-containing protein [Winogradskyella aurantiaca]|uniref:DUF3078 domain-containing protein n=1 Tax=Winogradskyella aurantiaca TaxID=2219558 RepID=UPI000E1D8FC3|nr:DUF3078 domain-containing protein [Winogradskyella aurantiaca]
MKKHICLLILLVLVSTFSFAQTKEELEAQQATYQAEVDKHQAQVDSIQSIIDNLPGWRTKVFGTVGFSLSEFNNYYAQGSPNNNAGSIGFTVNGRANRNEEKYFWNNSLTLNLQWVKFDDKDDPTDDTGFKATTDVFNLQSLYGYKLSSKWAASAFGEYRTTLIDNFNNPGYLDLGIGFTWTPFDGFVLVLHPLNLNFVFADNTEVFDSSLGAKIVADYNKSFGDFNISSNLSMFQSYKSSNLSNWTWTNSFGYTLWKGIGLGFDFALRDNKQEAVNYIQGLDPELGGDPDATFDSINNKLQTFWTFGLSYKF